MKLKKLIAIILVAVLCFSFTACGNKTPTKDEMLEVATECYVSDIENDSRENIVNAKQKYCDKTLLLTGIVRAIKEDHIELTASTKDYYYKTTYMIDVYLPTEELASIKPLETIKVVGTTTDEIIEDEKIINNYTFKYSHYQMPSAYLVKD